MAEPINTELLRELFELLDKHPFKFPHAEEVVETEEGMTIGLTASGTFAWSMPTEDYEAMKRWEGHESHGD